MKNSITSFVFLFVLSLSLKNIAFAQSTVTPVQGTPIVLEHDPAGIAIRPVKTDGKGSFSFAKLTAGKYKLTIPYGQVTKALSDVNKSYAAKPGNYEIDLVLQGVASDGSIFDRWGNMVKATTKIIINKETSVISTVVPKGGGSLNGTLSLNKITMNPR